MSEDKDPVKLSDSRLIYTESDVMAQKMVESYSGP